MTIIQKAVDKVLKYIKQVHRFQSTYMRRNWPTSPSDHDRSSRVNVAVVVVNWNTVDLLSALLFSLCRIVGREQISRIVVVDNNSTDGSRPLLSSMADAGLIDVIFNSHQRYHGPGLNDGIQFLERLQRNPTCPKDITDYIWVLDSDVIVLRKDVIRDAVSAMRRTNAALCGQFQTDAMLEGYAHISSIIFEPYKIWLRGVTPFEEHGTPGLAMQQSMIHRHLKRLDFPFRALGYLVHYGRGTLRMINYRNEQSNKYHIWAKDHYDYHYGDPNGRYLHEEFQTVYKREVLDPSPHSIVELCLRPQQIRLHRPYEIANKVSVFDR